MKLGVEEGKRYRVTIGLNRDLVSPADIKAAREGKGITANGPDILIEVGTEAEVLLVDGLGTALLRLMSGEYAGWGIMSSKKTQGVFELVEPTVKNEPSETD